jgi:hypothetical protein
VVAMNDALELGSWRALFGIASVLTAGGVVAARLGVYEAGFVALVLPLALIALNNASRACVLIALTSPVVALGAVDVGFHLLPAYPLIAAGFLGTVWRRGWRGCRPTAADVLLIGFAVLASAITVANIGLIPNSTVLNAVGANGPRLRPFAQLLALLAMACLYLLFRTGIRTRAEFGSVLRALLVAAAFVGAYLVYQVVGRRLGLPFTFVNQRRAVGTLPTNLTYIRPNSTLPEASALAQFAIIPLFLGAGWASSRPLPRWLPPQAPLLIGLAGATAVVATLSKIGLIATAVWLPLLLLRTARRRRRSWVFAVAVLAALVAAVGGVMAARAASQSITGTALIANERYVRTGYWIAAARMSADHPLGVGVGNFPFYYPEYAPLSLRYEYLSELADAHNLFLEAAAETGLVGGMLLLAFVVTVVVQGLLSAGRAPQNDDLPTTGTALAFAFAAGATMHLTYSYVYYPFEWVVAGLVATLPSLAVAARNQVRTRPFAD